MAGNRSSAATWKTRGSACALVFGLASTAFAQSGTVSSGCGYEIIETLPNGPQCGFDPYRPVIQDIADDGSVCGYAFAFPCADRAFVQSPGGPLVFLPVPPGSLGSRANALNSNGVVVGVFRGPDDVFKPCKWINGVFQALPIPRNANGGEAADVNSSGDVAGHWANYNTGPVHACVWHKSELTDIHPGEPSTSSKAFAMNDTLEVAGTLFMGAGEDRAFYWSSLSGMIALPAVVGGTTSQGEAIDGDGNVVGIGAFRISGQSAVGFRSFIWRDGQMIDLGMLPGITRLIARDVNDSGRIVARTLPGGRLAIWDNGVLQMALSNGLPVTCLLPSINNSGMIGDSSRRIAPLARNIADIDNNCAVNTDDLLEVISGWGSTDSLADLNNDSIVDGADLQLVILNWG